MLGKDIEILLNWMKGKNWPSHVSIKVMNAEDDFLNMKKALEPDEVETDIGHDDKNDEICPNCKWGRLGSE